MVSCLTHPALLTQVELCCRVASLLVRLHNAQLMATPSARPALTQLAGLLRRRTRELRDVLGVNLAGLGHLSDSLKERQQAFA
jgi:U3 small nucleolar RNA-associated protein 12